MPAARNRLRASLMQCLLILAVVASAPAAEIFYIGVQSGGNPVSGATVTIDDGTVVETATQTGPGVYQDGFNGVKTVTVRVEADDHCIFERSMFRIDATDGVPDVLNVVLIRPTLSLTMRFPATVEEGGTGVSATLGIDCALPNALVIGLSHGSSRISNPASATIAAGNLSTSIPITPVDNDLIDGDEPVTVTAATAWTGVDATITVLDDDDSLPAQQPFGGSPFAIAASGSSRLQAEDYDLGGEAIAYHDTGSGNQGGAYRSDGVDLQGTSDVGGGYNVGWIAAGEWLEYSVDVAVAGTYAVDLRVARQPTGSASLHLESDGMAISPQVAVPSTGGWQTWTTVGTELELSAGQQVLRVAMDGSGFNLNWLALTRLDGSGRSPFHGSPTVIAASGTTRLQAEDFDLGGEGVAYHDGDSGNNGGAYRSEDVDIQVLGGGGGYNVGWIAAGEWLEYTVDVESAGSYELVLRVARRPSGASGLHLEVAGVDLSGAVGLPSTGGWQTWTTVTTAVDLEAGEQVLRVAMDGSSFNLDWMEFTSTAGAAMLDSSSAEYPLGAINQ